MLFNYKPILIFNKKKEVKILFSSLRFTLISFFVLKFLNNFFQQFKRKNKEKRNLFFNKKLKNMNKKYNTFPS